MSWGNIVYKLVSISLALTLAGCGGKSYTASESKVSPAPVYSRDIPKTQKYHVVRRGDTLYGIGYRSGYGYKRLAKWNNIRPPYRLYIGQKIKLFASKQQLSAKTTTKPKSGDVKKTRNLSQKSLMISNDKKKVLKLHWQWPIKGRILKNFSQTGNKGIDIGGNWGEPVKAAADGKVVYSGQGLVGYGNLLIIKHNSQYLSAYGNNRRLLVQEGQTVRQGQAIAEVGKAGGSQTSLHFEIRKKGKPVNPENYLP